MKALKILGLGVIALVNVACDVSKEDACKDCVSLTLELCELKYEECESISDCKVKDIKEEFANGHCAK